MEVYKDRLKGVPLPLTTYLNEPDLEKCRLEGYTVFEACEAGLLPQVATFLAAGVNPNAHDEDGSSLLHYAARGGSELIMAFLLTNGANIDGEDDIGNTALMWACSEGEAEAVTFLLGKGAARNHANKHGQSAFTFAVRHPMCLHALCEFGGVPTDLVASENLLHTAAGKAGNRFGVLYLLEMMGANPNQPSSNGGEVPLVIAARTGDEDLVKALVMKGAELSGVPTKLANVAPRIQSLLSKLRSTSSIAKRELLCVPDFSNWAALDKNQVLQFTVAFFLPNVVLFLFAKISVLFWLFGIVFAGAGIMMVANFAMRQRGRSLSTSGWFFGVICFGMYVLITEVYPHYLAYFPDTVLMYAFYPVLFIMSYSYLRAVLVDPGCVQSSQESRKFCYESLTKASKREECDYTAMVRKPNRSKHCSKTNQCVTRFDHYCVWTANAIGGGNHRPFYFFLVGMLVDQTIVTIMTVHYFITNIPPLEHFSALGMCHWISAFVSPDVRLVVAYMIVINGFTFMFVSVMLSTQTWYMIRNVTSNEVWFADRYKWMMKLGSRAFNLYDEGPIRNAVGFLWSANLCKIEFETPPMNDHIRNVTRRFTAGIQRQQEAGSAGGSASSPMTASPTTPQSQLGNVLAQLPVEKQLEMTAVQAVFTMLIQGKEPMCPDTIPADRREAVVSQAHNMHKMYLDRMAQMKQQSHQ